MEDRRFGKTTDERRFGQKDRRERSWIEARPGDRREMRG
jgi:hypothetical protein